MLMTALALTATAGCAGAQSQGAAPARGAASGNAITVQGKGGALRDAVGFSYSAPVTMGPDGVVRAAEYPVITEVLADSPAQGAGLAPGDVILAVNGRDGKSAALFARREPGTRYTVRVRSGDVERDVELVVRARAPQRP